MDPESEEFEEEFETEYSPPVPQSSRYESAPTTAVKKPRAKKGAYVPPIITRKRGDDLATADPRNPDVLETDVGLEPFIAPAMQEYERLKARDPNKIKIGGKMLYPIQYVMASVFVKSTGITRLFANTSLGKTLLAFEAAKQIQDAGGNCLIQVPSGTINTWWAQGKEEKLINPKPELTKFFLYDPQKGKKHVEYLEKNIDTIPRDKGIVIIAKDASVYKPPKKGGLPSPGPQAINLFLRRGGPLSIIVDEGHMKKESLIGMNKLYLDKAGSKIKIVRELLMSGSEIPLGVMRDLLIPGTRVSSFDDLPSHHYMSTPLVGNIPLAKWNIIDLSGDATGYGGDAWKDNMKDIFARHKRIIVSSQNVEFYKIQQDIIPPDFVTVPSGVGSEKKFATEPKAVIHLTTVQGKGLNLLGDAMIIASVEGLSIDSLMQLSRRPLRSNNPTDVVTIYVFIYTQQEYYKAYYASAFSYIGWSFGYDTEANPQLVSKALVLPRVLGADVDKLGTVDRCTVLANYMDMDMSEGEKRVLIYEWRDRQLAELGEETIFVGDYANGVDYYLK